MLTLGIICINLAALLYTLSIWTERITKKLKRWILLVFTTAFTCDIVGTSMMFLVAKEKFSFETHSICGYSALFIMGLHLLWAMKSIKNPEKYQKKFTKYSVYAWVIWITAFVSGIPKI